jgi:PII-like signaling protein
VKPPRSNRPHLPTHHLPIGVSIVDSAENAARLLSVVEEMMHTGLIAVSDAEVIRIRRSKPNP